MSENVDTLKSLHTALIDSRHGYEEALEDADGKGLTSLFQRMIAMHGRHGSEIETWLRARGEKVDESGSFMTTVHRTIMSVRSVLTGLGTSILPGLVDGEERILGYYDEAIIAFQPEDVEHRGLAIQRNAVQQAISHMRQLQMQTAG